METQPDFVHRKRPDGLWEAICTRCFCTVATEPPANDIEGLSDAKAAHNCRD
jgi:hypothetical protein